MRCDNVSKRALQEIKTNQGSQEDSQKTTSSSMETVPTDFIDGSFSDHEEQPEHWGRLFPLSQVFDAIDLHKEEHTFGRGDECDYQFRLLNHAKGKAIYQTYSKVHFVLKREKTSSGTYTFLIDRSSNGTFVNKELVGKGNKQVLNNNDEISLSLEKNRAFMYNDMLDDQQNIPEAVREKYVLTRTLGEGGYGLVRLAFEKGTSNRVAIKIMAKSLLTARGNNAFDMSSYIQREVQLLKSLKHPCIVSILDVIDTPEKLYVVLEFVEGGELFDRVLACKCIPEPECKVLFYQMVHAVKYLHDQNVVHRDIKPENILLSMTDSNETLVKITDFGVSKFVDQQTKLKTFVGTMDYIAPEILQTRGTQPYTSAVDIWSLGVVLYICLSGTKPFNSGMEVPIEQQILEGKWDFKDPEWIPISKQAKTLIKAMLTINPKKRITVSQVTQHPWLQDEEVKKKAEKLMYGEMAPPASTSSPQKKRKVDQQDDGPSKRK